MPKNNKLHLEGDSYWVNRPFDDPRKDWRDDSDWITGYWNSQSHPHRRMILKALEEFEPFTSLLEVGCNCGPNLKIIGDKYPDVELSGFDLNSHAVGEAQILVQEAEIKIGNVDRIPFVRTFDVVLADAVLMYIEPERIRRVIEGMMSNAKKGLIIVDWYDKNSLMGQINEFHWCRNYEKLLQEYGLVTRKIKITKKVWPSKNWSKLGYLFIAKYPQVLPTSERK